MSEDTKKIFRDWFQRQFSDPQLLILALLLVTGVVLTLLLGEILAPALAAVIIAYLLEGLVGFFEQRKVPRMAAVLIVFLSFMAFFFFLFFALLPTISFQLGQAVGELPAMLAKGKNSLLLLPERYPEFISKDQILSLFSALQTELGNMGKTVLSISLASVRGLVAFVIYLILVPLMVFFFLKDKIKIINWLAHYFPENRKVSKQVWQEVDVQIGNYVRGKFWEILIIWTTSYVAFLFLNLRFAMLVSLLVGLSVLIPYIGVTVVAFPVGLFGFFQWGWDAQLFYLLLTYAIIQLIDGNLLAPLLFSEVVDLHPTAIIISVLLFGGIWGFWGVFFAIPLATLVHAVLRAWQHRLQIKDDQQNANKEK